MGGKDYKRRMILLPLLAVSLSVPADWAPSDLKVGDMDLPAVAAAPIPTEGDPIDVQHNPVAHMYITLKAYSYYASRYEGGELGRYIGGIKDGKPASDAHDTVTAGAFEEDKSYQNPFNELIPVLRHFWNPGGGMFMGIGGNDSGVNRAHKYFSGGYGIDGKYDRTWDGNDGKFRGTKGLGAEALYRAGDKGKAYWYLGHAAHMLEDITVPAHVHLWPHVLPGSDAYEHYMKENFMRWTDLPAGPVEQFPSLYDLFLETARVTAGYDTGAGPGAKGRDGLRDNGARRAGGFTPAELDQEGDALMPLAFKRVAALYLHFFKRVDKTPPEVALAAPAEPLPGIVTLRASAEDKISGVDRQGYRFWARSFLDGRWTPWEAVTGLTGASASVAVASGRFYAFKATALDAAANEGRSAVRTHRTADPAVALSR